MMTLIMVLMLALGPVEGMLAGDEPVAAAAQGTPSAPPAQAPDPDRPAISSTELKALRDSNIFAPRNAKKRPVYTSRESSKPRTPSAPAQPKPPVVTGIFMDVKQQCYIVVVEDRNDSSLRQFKEPKFLKTGDEACGYKIGPVTAEKAVFLKGDASKEYRVGEALGSTDAKVSDAAPSSDDPDAVPVEGEEKADKTEIKPLDNEEKTKVLEKMRRDRGKKARPSNDEQ